MNKILITAYGTMGDVLPYIALGQQMQARGYEVHIAIPEQMHPQAIAAGLKVLKVGHKQINPEEARKTALLWDHWSANIDDLQVKKELNESQTWFDLQKGIDCLLDAAANAKLIVCSPQQAIFAAIVAEKLSIPLVQVIITPALLYQPNNWWRLSQWMRQTKNTTYDRYHVLREKQGLTDSEGWKPYCTYDRLIFAASPYLYSSPPYCLTTNQTGFWFYEQPEWSEWQPGEKLAQFMVAEQKPLVLSFSSQPIRNREEFIAVHVRAAMKLGRRILIQGGWSDFNESHLPAEIDRDLVMFAGFMPQDWLFAHAAAVITHGGIGTIARALRNGCPMLLEPHTYEQCFNAHKVLDWGVGAAMYPEKLTVAGIARVLEKKVLTKNYQQQAQKIKVQIHTESGLDKACNLVETWL
ncbi:MAG: glycosyltransferase [Calothrix sp. MO_167.B12]|nr:glycosyltransferase [Calothrix sp. MO_167.B12]